MKQKIIKIPKDIHKSGYYVIEVPFNEVTSDIFCPLMLKTDWKTIRGDTVINSVSSIHEWIREKLFIKGYVFVPVDTRTYPGRRSIIVEDEKIPIIVTKHTSINKKTGEKEKEIHIQIVGSSITELKKYKQLIVSYIKEKTGISPKVFPWGPLLGCD